MANTLTSLIPAMYEALDVVSRELTGFIPAVSRSSSVARAALNQSVLVPVTNDADSANNTPGVTAPDTGDATVDNVEITISKSKHVPVRWNGEETRGLVNAGTFSTIQADRFYQAMRTLVNEIEYDVWYEAYRRASRAYGSAGTTPFATAGDMTDFSNTLRLLEENGAPTNDLQLVLGHAAMGNLRGKQSNLFKVNEAGSADMLRNGMTDRIMNMAIRHSHRVGIHTPGTAQGVSPAYLVDQGTSPAGYVAEDTTIHLDTGSGTHIPGDVISFAGDTNKYVIGTGASGSGDKDIVLAKPGLKASLANDVSTSLLAAYTANVAFARSAIVLATRAPALPEGGDAADDSMMLVDDRTGLAFEVAVYRQFLQTVYHVRLAWGFRAIKPEHIGILVG